MYNLYSHLNYKKALEEIFEVKKSLPGKWTLRALAAEAGLQPSFLTNVLKDRCEFNADQLYSICEILGLTVAERSYLMLLLEHERAVHRPRKLELRAQIDELRSQAQRTERHLSVDKVDLSPDALAYYYLDPFIQLVHVHLAMPPYEANPERLCAVLGISKSHLAEILDGLVRIGYIRREKTGYKVVARNKHLPKDSPLSGPFLILMRQKSLDQLQRLADKEKYSFSVTFTGTDETRAGLQEAFMAYLKKAEGLVKSAPSQKSYQMNFDLFPWEI